MPKLSQDGIAHFLILFIVIAAFGLIFFLLIASFAPFKNGFSLLFPKPHSHAVTNFEPFNLKVSNASIPTKNVAVVSSAGASSTMTIAPSITPAASLLVGQSATITIGVTTTQDTTLSLTVIVHGLNGIVLAQQSFNNQNLTANQLSNLAFNWTPSIATVFSVEINVFQNGVLINQNPNAMSGEVYQQLSTPIATSSANISDFAYTPQTITVPLGTTVTWLNTTTLTNHTITSDKGLFDSGIIAPGDGYRITFNGAGVFTFHCTNHPSMTGMVIVTTTSPTLSPSPTPACPKGGLGDIDCNGLINIFDYNLIVTNFGKTGSGIQGDIDKSGKVDIFDYNILVTNFGK